MVKLNFLDIVLPPTDDILNRLPKGNKYIITISELDINKFKENIDVVKEYFPNEIEKIENINNGSIKQDGGNLNNENKKLLMKEYIKQTQIKDQYSQLRNMFISFIKNKFQENDIDESIQIFINFII